MEQKKLFQQLTSPLTLAVILLMGIGLVQVYSSSYILAIENYGDGLYFVKKQFIFFILSLFVLVLASEIPLSILKKYSWLMWLFSGLLVLATFIPGLGVKVGGATRWLNLPFGFRFEPAEILKFSFPLLVATFFNLKDTWLKKAPKYVLFLVAVVPMFLLLKQPDFGSFAIICAVGFSLLFAFGLKWKYIVSAISVSIPAIYLLVMNVPYRRARVMAFLDPWADADQSGFQVIQSMLSFRTGGLFGVGLGQGQGKLFFLPEAHTDFTLAVLGEEIGFVGFMVILLFFGFIVLRGFQICLKLEDKMLKCLVLGMTLTFALSVFINSGVVMGLLPTKGLTLPFLSYGGSSLVVLSFIFGLVVNIERHVTKNKASNYI